MRALITRPAEDAEKLAQSLRERGVEPMVEPMLEIVPRDHGSIDLAEIQGILATSANGIRSLAAKIVRRDLPVWAVGEATTETARALGFTRIETGDGDVEGLARLVAAKAAPEAGILLHAAGTHQAGDLAGMLAQAGFSTRRVVLYEALAATRLTDGTVATLREGQIRYVLFFSPRTAATFVKLARTAALEEAFRAVTALCLSEGVARQLTALPFKAVITAATPTQAALLAALDHDLTRLAAAEPRQA